MQSLKLRFLRVLIPHVRNERISLVEHQGARRRRKCAMCAHKALPQQLLARVLGGAAARPLGRNGVQGLVHRWLLLAVDCKAETLKRSLAGRAESRALGLG